MKSQITALLLLSFSAMGQLVTNRENGKTIWFTNSDHFHFYFSNSLPEVSTVLRLQEVTNWTGYTFEGRELGYVATNHIASVVYQNATNEYTLKTVPSETAKWRKPEQHINIYVNPWQIMLTNVSYGY